MRDPIEDLAVLLIIAVAGAVFVFEMCKWLAGELSEGPRG